MSVWGSIFGGGIVKPIADAASDYGQSRQETAQWRHRAEAVIAVASSSWRPWLARLLGWCVLVHVLGSTVLMIGMASAAVWALPWSLQATWALWTAYGRELFDLTATLLGLYIGSRGLEKVAPSIGGPVGSALGTAAGWVTGRERERQPPHTIQEAARAPMRNTEDGPPPASPAGAGIRDAEPFMRPSHR